MERLLESKEEHRKIRAFLVLEFHKETLDVVRVPVESLVLVAITNRLLDLVGRDLVADK